MANWHQIEEFDLREARTNYQIKDFSQDGDCIVVLENENTELDKTYLKFDSPAAHAFDLYEHKKLRQKFNILYLTNIVASGKRLKLLIGKGDWEITRHYPQEEIA